jgi:hypothetical protein
MPGSPRPRSRSRSRERKPAATTTKFDWYPKLPPGYNPKNMFAKLEPKGPYYPPSPYDLWERHQLYVPNPEREKYLKDKMRLPEKHLPRSKGSKGGSRRRSRRGATRRSTRRA